jgi:pentose-5-phosphate-3-epimerase
MAIICPTITAETSADYKSQLEKVTSFAKRIQIDLMDGAFTMNRSVLPEEAWWPVGMHADLHLMFKDPLEATRTLVAHQPSLIIIHAEAKGSFRQVYELCKHKNVKIGIALLASTKPDVIKDVLAEIDHVLIFSGNLGHQGGSFADLSLLEKVDYLKDKNSQLEIGWDGGVNNRNVSELITGGVDVLNVGSYLQSAADAEKAYTDLFRIAEETGTT